MKKSKLVDINEVLVKHLSNQQEKYKNYDELLWGSYETETVEYDNEYEADWQGDDDWDIAARLMDVLVENKLDSYVLLKDSEIAEWWSGVLKERKAKEERRRKREEAKRKKQEEDRARAELLARLTPEEKRLLGIK